MADVFDAEKRSDIMRRVKSKKNKSTELRLIEIFKDHGITGWRRNYPVKGHPDFVFPKEKRRTGAGLRSEQHLSPTMSDGFPTGRRGQACAVLARSIRSLKKRERKPVNGITISPAEN